MFIVSNKTDGMHIATKGKTFSVKINYKSRDGPVKSAKTRKGRRTQEDYPATEKLW